LRFTPQITFLPSYLTFFFFFFCTVHEGSAIYSRISHAGGPAKLRFSVANWFPSDPPTGLPLSAPAVPRLLLALFAK
jgi:hypothetical protein